MEQCTFWGEFARLSGSFSDKERRGAPLLHSQSGQAYVLITVKFSDLTSSAMESGEWRDMIVFGCARRVDLSRRGSWRCVIKIAPQSYNSRMCVREFWSTV